MTETTDANTTPTDTPPTPPQLDAATATALEEWQRIRELPLTLTLDPETQDAYDEWVRIHQGKTGVFNPAKDFPVGKFNYLSNMRFRWLVPRVFDFVPKAEVPYSFTRYNGQTITPRRMFTDGGSIPRIARWIGQLDPWEYTPAYCLHDWIFELHHCNVANKQPDVYTFDDATEILMEAIHTMDHEGIAPVSDPVFHLIRIAVSSFIARRLWDADVKKCTLPPDMED